MKQVADVKEIRGEDAILTVKRQSMCDGCHKEGGCGHCSQVLEVTVKNTLGAEVGDKVEIETPGATVIGVAALVFLLPLLLSFLAFFLTELFGAATPYCYLAAVIAPLLCYLAISLTVRKSKVALKITMVAILPS